MYPKQAEYDRLFTIGEQVLYKGEAAQVTAEYKHAVCIEFVHYPIVEKKEEFPDPRVVIKKDACERT
ncbi:hypothetical protein [Bacillus sp. FJAT-44742]|uniref:hypothetical protein n=1 Tax=Bacillus sp. FJAT-44742 TaxID=2014005 RepID=UPI000C2408A0|nr:hypothetical protein [Bacillus sp. FJAT-44742]